MQEREEGGEYNEKALIKIVFLNLPSRRPLGGRGGLEMVLLAEKFAINNQSLGQSNAKVRV